MRTGSGFIRRRERAYQPCREHFEAQAKLRQANAEKRKAILQRLRAFEAAHSGENADWRAFVAVLREAPQEWRRHFPVERTPARELQKEFDAAIRRLQVRLDAWHAGNAEEKRRSSGAPPHSSTSRTAVRPPRP